MDKQGMQSNFFRTILGFFNSIYVRYITAGLTSAFINLAVLFICTHYLKVWYIFSSTIAFVTSLILSFSLHKFWTFGDKKITKIQHQFGLFVTMAVIMLYVNVSMMYFLVEYLNVWYLLAQFLVNVFIAVTNFLLYKFLIFRKKLDNIVTDQENQKNV